MKIYFVRHGRFGNNIFQYIVAKILCKEHGYELVDSARDLGFRFVNFNDIMWHRWVLEKRILYGRPILVNGFFQRLDMLLPYRDYIKSLLHEDNHEFINDTIRVSDLVRAYNSVDTPYHNEIVMHVRLDDFMHDRHNSHILHPEFYTSILDMIKGDDKLSIVCDTLKNKEEEEYMREFERYSPEFRTRSMLEDFAYIMKAKRLISSNSTFAFVASFLGDPEEVYIPWTNFYKEQGYCQFAPKFSIVPAMCIDIYSGQVKNYLNE